MNTLALAIRNLLRNRRRSIATLLSISLGSIAVLLFGGYSKSIKLSMQTTYVQNGGHLQIQHRDFNLYGSGNPTAFGISGYEKIIAAVRADDVLRDMVLEATPTLQFGGIAGNYAAGVSRTVIGNGMVASEYARMRQWNDYALPPTNTAFSLEGTGADAAIAGIGLARVLRLCESLKIANCAAPPDEKAPAAADAKSLPDDIAQLSRLDAPAGAAPSGRQIELLTTSARGAPNVASLQVVKAESEGFKELDEIHLVMHLAQTQRLIYGKDAPKITAIMLQLRHTSQLAAARARLDGILASAGAGQPLAVLDFELLNPFYVQTIRLFDTIFNFMFVLIGGIVLFTVGNTMNTAIVERTVEIGTLRAIGLRQGGIRALFVLEGLLLGVFGALAGVICALIASVIINHSGLTWLPPTVTNPVPLNLLVWGEWWMILGTAFGLVAVTTLSAWWPARRAAQMDIVDALRHV